MSNPRIRAMIAKNTTLAGIIAAGALALLSVLLLAPSMTKSPAQLMQEAKNAKNPSGSIVVVKPDR